MVHSKKKKKKNLLKKDFYIYVFPFSFFFFSFIFISWRLITSQHFSGFCHTLTWISHGVTWIPHPDPPSHLPLWVFPVHQARALVSCIPPGLLICFTLSLKISHPRLLPESKSLFCTSVSLFLFCIKGEHYHLSKFHIYVLVCCNVLYLSGLLHSV